MHHKKEDLEHIIKKTQILQIPRHLLATFAVTDIEYHFVSSVSENRSRIRQGVIKAEKPAIISPFSSSEILEGFSDEAQEFIDKLARMTGTDLRMLGYHFKNEMHKVSLQQKSAEKVVEKLKLDLHDKPRTAILTGLDHAWQVALLKLIIEHTGNSFPANVKELEERGFFPDSTGVTTRIRWHIESLFKKARFSPDMVRELGRALKEYKLFEEYEDRFFTLIKYHKNHP